jgi:hypothetical protein
MSRALRGLVVWGLSFAVIVGAPAVHGADALATVLAGIVLVGGVVTYGGWLARESDSTYE